MVGRDRGGGRGIRYIDSTESRTLIEDMLRQKLLRQGRVKARMEIPESRRKPLDSPEGVSEEDEHTKVDVNRCYVVHENPVFSQHTHLFSPEGGSEDDGYTFNEKPFHNCVVHESHHGRLRNRLIKSLDLNTRREVEVDDMCGKMHAEDFLHWETSIEKYFEWQPMTEARKVRFVKLKLKGSTLQWWKRLQERRMRQDKEKINTWVHMKQKLRKQFLPSDYMVRMHKKFPLSQRDLSKSTKVTSTSVKTTDRSTSGVHKKRVNFIEDEFVGKELKFDEFVSGEPIHDELVSQKLKYDELVPEELKFDDFIIEELHYDELVSEETKYDGPESEDEVVIDWDLPPVYDCCPEVEDTVLFTSVGIDPSIKEDSSLEAEAEAEAEVFFQSGYIDHVTQEHTKIVSIPVNPTHSVYENQATHPVHDFSLGSEALHTVQTICTVDDPNLRSNYHKGEVSRKEDCRENYLSKIRGRILSNEGRSVMMEDLIGKLGTDVYYSSTTYDKNGAQAEIVEDREACADDITCIHHKVCAITNKKKTLEWTRVSLSSMERLVASSYYKVRLSVLEGSAYSVTEEAFSTVDRNLIIEVLEALENDSLSDESVYNRNCCKMFASWDMLTILSVEKETTMKTIVLAARLTPGPSCSLRTACVYDHQQQLKLESISTDLIYCQQGLWVVSIFLVIMLAVWLEYLVPALRNSLVDIIFRIVDANECLLSSGTYKLHHLSVLIETVNENGQYIDTSNVNQRCTEWLRGDKVMVLVFDQGKYTEAANTNLLSIQNKDGPDTLQKFKKDAPKQLLFHETAVLQFSTTSATVDILGKVLAIYKTLSCRLLLYNSATDDHVQNMSAGRKMEIICMTLIREDQTSLETYDIETDLWTSIEGSYSLVHTTQERISTTSFYGKRWSGLLFSILESVVTFWLMVLTLSLTMDVVQKELKLMNATHEENVPTKQEIMLTGVTSTKDDQSNLEEYIAILSSESPELIQSACCVEEVLVTNTDVKLGHVTVLEETPSKISGMYTMEAYANIQWKHMLIDGTKYHKEN